MMFGFIKKMFIELLASIINAANFPKCLSLNYQQCMIKLFITDLHSKEHNQGLHNTHNHFWFILFHKHS